MINNRDITIQKCVLFVTVNLVENEDLVGAVPTGDAPTTSEGSTILSSTNAWFILEVWR